MITTTNIQLKNCRDEQDFKMYCVRNQRAKKNINADVFCIETEETVKGFPDVMIVPFEGNIFFQEYKYSNAQGKIRFQPTQPSFYRSHPVMDITVVALNAKTGLIHVFGVEELFDEESPYHMNEKAEVDLCKAESNFPLTK